MNSPTVSERVIFPLDKRWRVDQQGYSQGLSYQLVWLSGLLPYKQVEDVLRELVALSLGSSSIWQQVQVHGERLRRHVEHQRAHVSVERTRWESRYYDPKLTRCVSLDGGMVCLRNEGWKEMKVGLISNLQVDFRSDTAPVRQIEMDYDAVIGGVEQFSDCLWALACKHFVPYAGRLVTVADGAVWIWRLVNDLFPVGTQIVDYYHAKQHLAQAAQEIYPDDAAQRHKWLKNMNDALFRGEIFKIATAFQQHNLNPHYFIKHQQRMQYQQFRASGLPIGSGAVESAIKQFRHRLTAAGMRWSRRGAERMITIRAAVLTDSLNRLWQQAA